MYYRDPRRGFPPYPQTRVLVNRGMNWTPIISLALVLGILIAGLFYWPHIQDLLNGVGVKTSTATINVTAEEVEMTNKGVYGTVDLTIIEQGTETALFGLIQATRYAVGTAHVEAGIDYMLHPPDFQVNGKSVAVTVSTPTILSKGLTSVYYIDATGLWVASTDLSNQLNSTLSGEIEARALKTDLLSKAKKEAKIAIDDNLRRLGFTDVQVNFV